MTKVQRWCYDATPSALIIVLFNQYFEPIKLSSAKSILIGTLSKYEQPEQTETMLAVCHEPLTNNRRYPSATYRIYRKRLLCPPALVHAFGSHNLKDNT